MHGVQTKKQTQHVIENPGSIELNASFKTLIGFFGFILYSLKALQSISIHSIHEDPHM